MAIGFAVGLIVPAITWLMAEVIFKNYTATLNKPSAPYLIGIAVNLFIIRYFFKNDLPKRYRRHTLYLYIHGSSFFI